MPKTEYNQISETEGNKIMHVSMLMTFESREEADKLFKGLSEGGVVIMPMENTFWGAYFGMFTDKFGINWMINFDENPSA